MPRRFLSTALILVLATLVAVPAVAAPRLWSNPGISATMRPSLVDTTTTINASRCSDLHFVIAGEMDSLLYTLQGSEDGTNWVTLKSAQINGTDGTYAIQASTSLSQIGTAGTDTQLYPPPSFVRAILNNNDTAGADTVGALTVRFRCN